jgi:SAM-dependent methyltransferase
MMSLGARFAIGHELVLIANRNSSRYLMSNVITKNVVGVVHDELIFKRRTRVLAKHIARIIPKDSIVLDVGCGDGTIDALVKKNRPDLNIRGVDVLLRPITEIPVDLFDGKHLPFADKTFDVIMFIDVLHHTENPLVLLREAARVARRTVVLKDHTMDGLFAFWRLRLMDWVGNARHGVALPYNYWPEQRWRDAFEALGMRIGDWQSHLGLYPTPASLAFDSRLQFCVALEVS